MTPDTETALFFPYIRVLEEAWFTQVLLYWDQAATIVPKSEWEKEQNPYPKYMHDLVNAGLLKLLRPDDELHRAQKDMDFTQGFIKLLAACPSPVKPYKYVRMHTLKIPLTLFFYLREKKLAQFEEPFEEHESWWMIEESTAALYMGYLAGAISGASPGTIPVTERSDAFGENKTIRLPLDEASVGKQSYRQTATQLRYKMIAEALPAPQGTVPADELRRFKDDNYEALRRCKLHIDQRLLLMGTTDEPESEEWRWSTIKEGIEGDVSRLQEQMNKRRWPKVALVGVGGVVAAAGGAAIATAPVTGPLLAFSIALGMVQLAAPTYTLVEEIRKPSYDENAPLAYAALAGRL